MKLLRIFMTGAALCMMLFTTAAVAQPPSPCNPCVNFCSWTQGGWGAPCNGGNVGCLRNQYFASVYPNGVTVGRDYPGGCCWIHLTSSQAVEDFLPQGTTAEALTQNYTDPGVGNITVFAGQVLALELNVDFGNAGIGGMPSIGGLVIGSGPFAGWTVNQLLAAGNQALGGGALPPGVTIGDLNDACDAVNNNFDDCINNNHYLITPPQGQTVVIRNQDQNDFPYHACLNFTAQCSDICLVWWCADCNPDHDFGIFSYVPGCTDCGNGGECTPNTGNINGFGNDNQHIFFTDPNGDGCWWYALITADAAGCICVTMERQLNVELTSFSAVPGNAEVTLAWTTRSEINNDHFNVLRSTDGANWTTITQVAGQGTVSTTTNYTYMDRSVINGAHYSYKLAVVDNNGNVREIGTVQSATPGTTATPKEFALYQNYPNPFNPTTSIRFDVAKSGLVTLRVYNMIGQEVATLVNSNMEVGQHEVSFDASKLPSALYLYRLDAEGFTATNKMLLLK